MRGGNISLKCQAEREEGYPPSLLPFVWLLRTTLVCAERLHQLKSCSRCSGAVCLVSTVTTFLVHEDMLSRFPSSIPPCQVAGAKKLAIMAHTATSRSSLEAWLWTSIPHLDCFSPQDNIFSCHSGTSVLPISGLPEPAHASLRQDDFSLNSTKPCTVLGTRYLLGINTLMGRETV